MKILRIAIGFALTLFMPSIEAGLETSRELLHSNVSGTSLSVVDDAPGDGLILVKLWRVNARDDHDGASKANGHFYVARIAVGSPQLQELLVTFDTSSGQVVLPSWKCGQPTCLAHRRFGSVASPSATDINANGSMVQEGVRIIRHGVKRDTVKIGVSTIDLGNGYFAGELVHETVCVTGHGRQQFCTKLGVVAATEMSETPFRVMPQDGTIGLGLSPLSINSLFSFFSRMMSETPSMRLPQFGFFFGERGGELALGGYDSTRLADGADGLAWNSVVRPDEGYWQVRIKSVRVGNFTLDICEQGICRGIIDSSARHIGVPTSLLPSLTDALLAGTTDSGKTDSSKRTCQSPDIHIELEGLTLELRAEDIGDERVDAADSGSPCQPSLDLLMPLNLPETFAGVFVLGEPVLRRYYSVFDWELQRVGLGHAAPEHTEDQQEDEEVMQEIPDLPLDWVSADALGMKDAPYEFTFLLRLAVMLQVGLFLVQTCLKPMLLSSHVLVGRFRLALVRCRLLSGEACFAMPVPPGGTSGQEECVICLGSSQEESSLLTSTSSLLSRWFASWIHVCGCSSAASRWCRLNCGHHFHDECIFRWLMKSPRCPVCRSEVLTSKSTAWPRSA